MVNFPLDVNILLLAPLAPIIGVIVFWFTQLLFIENQKHVLAHLKHRHEALCRFTNFVGILFQTVCHALGYTVTRSGIQHFQVSVNYGKVSPKKEKTGVFEWISNSFLFIGPFFIPAGLLLLCSYIVIGDGFQVKTPVSYQFTEQLSLLGSALYGFAEAFTNFLLRIDLLNPIHVGFLLLLIFFGMGIRPSYMGEQRKEKIDIMYDLNNIQNHLRQHLLYLMILILIAYGIFYISLMLNTNWYLLLFSVLGWTSLTAIAAMILAYLLLILIKTTDEIHGVWKIFPYLTIVLSYGLLRALFYYYIIIDNATTIALLIMILCTMVVTILLYKYKTNTFKTVSKMKHMKVEDGKKRTSQKRTR